MNIKNRMIEFLTRVTTDVGLTAIAGVFALGLLVVFFIGVLSNGAS